MNIRARWKSAVVLVILSVSLLYGLAYLLAAKSDAFEVASEFLITNAEVARVAGTVQATSLSWAGWEIETSGARGSAKLTINVVGTSASPQAYVELRKRGVWEVSFARLVPSTGTPIDLKDTELSNAL